MKDESDNVHRIDATTCAVTATVSGMDAWTPTAVLRWRKPHPDPMQALVEATHGKEAPVLQQEWHCVITGERQWRDVPKEDA